MATNSSLTDIQFISALRLMSWSRAKCEMLITFSHQTIGLGPFFLDPISIASANKETTNQVDGSLNINCKEI